MIDSRRLVVVADGLPLFGGVQLAIDTTLVSDLRGDGSARHTASRNGVALVDARRRKERTYPDFAGDAGRARFFAAEVGGRWSDETLLLPTQSHGQPPGPCKVRPELFGSADGASCPCSAATTLSILRVQKKKSSPR